MPSPLVQRLYQQLGYPRLNATQVPDFLSQQAFSVLFFTEDPKRFPETNDVAVILPELVKAFKGQFAAAVIATEDEKKLQSLYGFQAWPALVFLKGNEYLGTITGVQDWGVYLDEINKILASEPSRPLSIGIPVVSH
ncbi:MAG: hydrogenase expression/formation protein [Pseudomonadota bacterium]